MYEHRLEENRIAVEQNYKWHFVNYGIQIGKYIFTKKCSQRRKENNPLKTGTGSNPTPYGEQWQFRYLEEETLKPAVFT